MRHRQAGYDRPTDSDNPYSDDPGDHPLDHGLIHIYLTCDLRRSRVDRQGMAAMRGLVKAVGIQTERLPSRIVSNHATRRARSG